MPVISVRSSLKPDACTGGGWVRAWGGGLWQPSSAAGAACMQHIRACTRRAHAEQMQRGVQRRAHCRVQRRVQRGVQRGVQRRARYLESVHDVLLRVEVGARGLRRAGEQLAELLEAAVVPAAGAQAALEGRSRLAPCWRGGRLPRLPRATATGRPPVPLPPHI